MEQRFFERVDTGVVTGVVRKSESPKVRKKLRLKVSSNAIKLRKRPLI